MANPSLRRFGPAALGLTTIALVIGCGGGGGGGSSTSGTSGATSATTSGATSATTAGTNSTTAGTTSTTSGTLGGGGTATSTGKLPADSIFYAVSNGSTFDVDYIKEDGTGGGTYVSGVPTGNAVVSPDPSATGEYVFTALPTSTATTYGIYRGTSQTVTGANTLVSARYSEVDGLDVARDGSKVVYIAATSAAGDLGLYSVSTVAGSSPSFIANAYDAQLDTDGTKVVYAADNAGQSDLYLRTLGGSASTALTATTDTQEDDPQFSKDGTKVVFSETLSDGTFRLGYLTTAGGAVTQINPFPANQDVVLRSPSFNSAGTRISFIAADSTDGSHSGLYTCDLNGANLIRVVASTQLLNATYWTTPQGRAIGSLPFHFAVSRKRAARP